MSCTINITVDTQCVISEMRAAAVAVVLWVVAAAVVYVFAMKCNECCVLEQCNNPKTKEPKLDAAMRIVPEWKDRDAEIRRLWDRVYSQHQQPSSDSSTDSTKTPRKCGLFDCGSVIFCKFAAHIVRFTLFSQQQKTRKEVEPIGIMICSPPTAVKL